MLSREVDGPVYSGTPALLGDMTMSNRVRARCAGWERWWEDCHSPSSGDSTAVAPGILTWEYQNTKLDASDQGTLVTKPFATGGRGLRVNADVRGELRAELLDAGTMEPIAGFSGGECDAVSGDHVSAAVTWGGRTTPPDGATVRVRFTLVDSDLYAFWLG